MFQTIVSVNIRILSGASPVFDVTIAQVNTEAPLGDGPGPVVAFSAYDERHAHDLAEAIAGALESHSTDGALCTNVLCNY